MNQKLVASVMLVAALLAGPVHAQLVTDAQIADGIEKLKQRLYASQNKNGYWDGDQPGNDHVTGINYGGTTALITYALLTSGESYQNPKLQRAIEFLEKCDMKGTYAVSCRAHVWSHIPPEFNKYLQKDLYWLQQASHEVSTGGISWRYQIDSKDWDNSTHQYGTLGCWEAAKRGNAVGQALWSGAEKHIIASQNDDGGWGYQQGDTRTSMTTAGLVTLYITQDYLHSQDFRTVGRARQHPLQAIIDKGLAWLDKNFKPGVNVGGNQEAYTMYGIERVGLASGRKYLGDQDWYQGGANWILSHMGSGSNAAFQLLFLVRGRVPVFINKLEIPDADWNNRPRDIARLTEWVSDEVEKEMLWQVVPITRAPEDWLDAPILYLASHTALDLKPEQIAKIKRYIDLGGMLVTTADNNSVEFTTSMRNMFKQMYPEYPLQALSKEDELNDVVFQVDANRLGVQAVDNGIRHLILHLPRDVSWTLHSSSMVDPTPWQFFANAYYYATEKGRTRNRLEQHFVKKEGGNGGAEIVVGRAKYAGNWDPEPLAWEVQTNFMHNASKATIKLQVVDLDKLPDRNTVPFVHVVGTDAVQFSDAQAASITSYVKSGGVIFFENAGGRGPFADSVMQMLTKAFPNDRVRPINLDSPVIKGGGIGGFDSSVVDYRAYALLRMGKVETPRFLAININGQPRVIVSGEDLTEAMLNQPVWGVFGYNTESAQKLMTNLVLYAKAGPQNAEPAPAAPAKSEDGTKPASK